VLATGVSAMNKAEIHELIITLKRQVDEALGKLQRVFIDGAHVVGCLREDMRNAADNLLWVVENSPESVDSGYLTSAANVIEYVGLRANDLAGRAEHDVNEVYSLYISGDTVASSTGFAVVAFSGENPALSDSLLKDETLVTYRRGRKYATRYLKFDTDLGKTYGEINDVLFGTTSDPERIASFTVRQAYDHLMGKLAPDDLVRASEYFSPKSERGKEHTVSRRERQRYAIATHVKDPEIARRLTVLSDHILEFYDVLQKAHTRGPLDIKQAVAAIRTVVQYLDLWADALAL
jgi:hypothetical protein